MSVSRNGDGTYNFKASSGGLVSALAGCKVSTIFCVDDFIRCTRTRLILILPGVFAFVHITEPTGLLMDWLAW